MDYMVRDRNPDINKAGLNEGEKLTGPNMDEDAGLAEGKKLT